MLNQIKQALENRQIALINTYSEQWLRYLIGEVEHQKELLHVHIKTDHWYQQYEKMYTERQLEIGRHAETKMKVEELRKALEELKPLVDDNEGMHIITRALGMKP